MPGFLPPIDKSGCYHGQLIQAKQSREKGDGILSRRSYPSDEEYA